MPFGNGESSSCKHEGYVKRLQRIRRSILIISDNSNYRDWQINSEDDFEVFGRVVKVWCGEEF